MKTEIISSEKIGSDQTHHVDAVIETHLRTPSTREQHEQGFESSSDIICRCAGCGAHARTVPVFNRIQCDAREEVISAVHHVMTGGDHCGPV